MSATDRDTLRSEAVSEDADAMQAIRARAAIFDLLSGLFRHAPDAAALSALRTGALADALADIGLTQDALFRGFDEKDLADEVAVEFARLFLLPGVLVSPHESVQLAGGSGILRGPETADVRDFYERTGFRLADALRMEPDHFSIELEFLGHLAREQAFALETGEAACARDAARYQREFLGRHLGRWAPRFLDRVSAHPDARLYRSLAALAKAFLAEADNDDSKREG